MGEFTTLKNILLIEHFYYIVIEHC